MAKTAEAKVREYVKARYPEVRGVRPTADRKKNGRTVFTYRIERPLPDGKTLTQVVRVTADASGRVVKATVSR
ncbi:MAG: hypothetical protein ACE5NC_02910 [Anaerolineae bacterium]